MIERAFLYGDLLFESIRVVDGKICYAPRHYKRLTESAAVLKFELPASLSEGFFIDEITRAVADKKLTRARVRFLLYRDGPGFYAPEMNRVKWNIEVAELLAPRSEVKKLGVFPHYKKPCNALSNLKSGNALIYVMAGLYAKEHGYDDCMILNEKGNVAEAISTNIFVVKNNVIYTPALSEGCIHGVMRDVVIDAVRAMNFRVEETSFDPSFVQEADEVFLTNASGGIVGVKAFGEHEYEGRVTDDLKAKVFLK